MKDWLMAIAGVVIIGVAIWLIVIFAPEVLVFLKGIVGIAAGIVGGVLLVFGVSGIKTARTENKEKKLEPAKTSSPDENKKE